MKTGLKNLARRFGVEAFRYRPGHHYVPDYYGRSAPKQRDIRDEPVFGPLAAQVIRDGRTLLYYDRLYTIYQALENAARLASADGCVQLGEVGVFRGGTSRFIASAAKQLGFPSFRLHSFDTFEGHDPRDVAQGTDGIHRPGWFGEATYEGVRDYLGDSNSVTLYKGRIQDTAGAVADLRFHFVHLDVDLRDPTVFALDFFDSRLVLGAHVVVDDYGFTSCPGVREAVDAFVANRPRYTLTRQLTGQCVLVKVSEESSHAS